MNPTHHISPVKSQLFHFWLVTSPVLLVKTDIDGACCEISNSLKAWLRPWSFWRFLQTTNGEWGDKTSKWRFNRHQLVFDQLQLGIFVVPREMETSKAKMEDQVDKQYRYILCIHIYIYICIYTSLKYLLHHWEK